MQRQVAIPVTLSRQCPRSGMDYKVTVHKALALKNPTI
jgi:hypothetical protein